MATNEILQFAETDTGTNLLTQAEYLADAQRPIGNQPGVARSKLVNKALRQASLIAAGLAEYIADNQANNITDALTPQNIADYLQAALTGALGVTPPQFDNDTSIATTAFVKRQGLATAGQVNISTGTTLTAANHVGMLLLANQASAMTLVLPVASTVQTGGCIAIQNAGTGNVTVTRQGTNLIYVGAGGNTSITIQPGEFALFETDGFNWSASGTALLSFAASFAVGKTTSGYQKLPSGLIIQWGIGQFDAQAGNVQTPTLAIAYPNAHLMAIATSASSSGEGGSASPPSVGALALSLTQVQVQQHINVAWDTYYYYLSIGY